MFRDSMKGLDKVFITEPPRGSVVMIVGRPGTLKSSIAHQIISSYLWKHSDENAVYVTFEETKESHMRNMESLGISIPAKQYFIEDIASFRHEINQSSTDFGDDEYAKIILQEVSKPFGLYYDHGSIREEILEGAGKSNSGAEEDKATKKIPTVMGFDSINAFEAMFGVPHRKMRFIMQDFFMRIRKKGVNALIIMEGEPDSLVQEYFMADGIIEVGIDRSTPHLPKRYLLVQKMRGTQHDMAPHMVNITKSGLEIGEPLIGWKNK